MVPMMKDFSEVNLLVTEKKGLFHESHSPSGTASATERQSVLPHGTAEQSFRFSLVCLSDSLLTCRECGERYREEESNINIMKWG